MVAVAAVAADTGDDLLRRGPALQLLQIPVIRQELPCHGKEIGLSLLQIPLHERRIPKASHRRAGDLDTAALEGLGIVYGVGMALGEVEPVYMGGRAVQATDLNDIGIALQLLAEVQEVLQGVAAGLLLLGRDLCLDEEISSADLLHPAKYLLGQGRPLRHGGPAVFVGALVQHRGHGASQNGGPVGHVEGAHVKAHVLGLLGPEGKLRNERLQPLRADPRLVPEHRGVVVAVFRDLVPVGRVGDIHIRGFNVHQRRGGQRAVFVDLCGDPPVTLHHLRVPHVVACAVHPGHAPILVRQVQIPLRVIPHRHGHGGRAVFRHIPVKLRGLLQRKALQGALGAHHPVFQGHAADLQRG